MEIINDDCINYLKTIPDNSLDLVITDPPYFIDNLGDDWNETKITNRETNSHIKHLPKGMKFSKKQGQDLYNFYLEVSKLIYMKLKPGAFFLSFICPRLYHKIACAIDDAGFDIRDQINWIYPVNIPKGMSITHIINKLKISNEEKEKLIEKYKGYKTPMLKSNFEPIVIAIKPLNKTYLNNELVYNTGLIDFNIKVGIDNDKVISNIITLEEFETTFDRNFLVNKPNKKEKGDFNFHISVKPVILLEHLIKIFSKKDSVILDPFAGSGSTGVACKNTERRCILIEKNVNYIEIIKKRLN